jgi:hypothetical protein
MIEVGSPEWWVARLYKKLGERRPLLQTATNYYEGQHNLAFATDKFREAFGGLFREFADNWCGVVVQAPAERMKVEGIRLSMPESQAVHDTVGWDMWQRNQLDAWSSTHHTGTLATGYGYMMVWGDEDGQPVITVEDPEQTIVEYEPGSLRKRAAGLKCWVDDWTGHEMAYLYLPDEIYKFRSARKVRLGSQTRTWHMLEEDSDGEPLPLANPIGEVPIVEFVNDPTLRGEGRSEIRRVIPIQNAINKGVTDMMVASEFSAFRGVAISGWTPEVNPETGQPDQRDVRRAIDRFLTFGDKDTKVHEFSPTDLGNYVKSIEMLVLHIAAQTRTPRHYLIQQGQSPSGDAIKSAETGLVAKVGERETHMGERYEEVYRLGFLVLGDKGRANAKSSEIRWADPEYRTEGERTDAVIKQYGAKLITWDKALERLGYTPQEIEDMRKQRASEVLLEQGANLNTLLSEAPEPEPEPEPTA